METGVDLKAFLQQQASEGLAESEGAFTVAREKALAKLAHFALPGDAHWVLKIVQAANLWKAPRLVVRQSRIATSFFFCPPVGSEFPTDSAILSALNAPTLSQEKPVHQLAMALRSLVQQSGLSFVLAIRQHEELGQPIFAGDEASDMNPRLREKWARLANEGVRLTVGHFRGNESFTGRYVPTFSRVPRRDVKILRLLQARCFTSRTPIDLDGRLLTRLYPSGKYVEDRRHRPIVRGLMEDSPAGGYLVSGLDVLSGQRPARTLEIKALPGIEDESSFLILGREWHTLNEKYRALSLLFSPGLTDPPGISGHHFWLVRHGVVVQQYRLLTEDCPHVSLQVCLNVNHCRTDLSGLNIESRGLANELIRAALETILKALSGLLGADYFLSDLQLPPGQESVSAMAAPADGVEALDRVGFSIFTCSLGFSVPSAQAGLLRLLDAGTRLAESYPSVETTLSQWSDVVIDDLRKLVRRLESTSSHLMRDEIDNPRP